jgi:hypothetical protein
VCLCAALFAGGACAEPVLVYSEDWGGGYGAWSGIGGFRAPGRMFVGHPLAPYALSVGGSCGMGLRASTIPQVRLEVRTLVYMLGSNRNGFSVNVRTQDGELIYKYSMGSRNRLAANAQPPGDQPRDSSLTYALSTPYELYSLWYPGTGQYLLGLRNVLTGEDGKDGPFFCRSGATPGAITFDQEGGQGPALLGKTEVRLGE